MVGHPRTQRHRNTSSNGNQKQVALGRQTRQRRSNNAGRRDESKLPAPPFQNVIDNHTWKRDQNTQERKSNQPSALVDPNMNSITPPKSSGPNMRNVKMRFIDSLSRKNAIRSECGRSYIRVALTPYEVKVEKRLLRIRS